MCMTDLLGQLGDRDIIANHFQIRKFELDCINFQRWYQQHQPKESTSLKKSSLIFQKRL